MTDKILYWATMVTAGLAFLLFVTTASMVNSNIKLQGDIGQRQMVINTAANVLPLNQQLSNALYDASIKNNDESIRQLLTAQGFTLPAKTDKAAAPKVADKATAKPVKQEAKSAEQE